MVLLIWVCLGYILSNNHKLLLYFRETVEETPAAVFYVVIGVKCIMLVILANVAFLSKRTVQQMSKDEAHKLDDISAKEKCCILQTPIIRHQKAPSPPAILQPTRMKLTQDTAMRKTNQTLLQIPLLKAQDPQVHPLQVHHIRRKRGQ